MQKWLLSLTFLLFSGNISAKVVEWTSDESAARIEQSQHKVDFFPLANQFENQTNKAFCGPTSVAIVLNALRLRDESLTKPIEQSLVEPSLRTHLPDPVIPRYTPNTVFTAETKTRFQVFGDPIEIQGKPTKDYGLQLRQLHTLVKANGLTSELNVVDDKADTEKIKSALIQNLETKNDYVLVNYERKILGQVNKEGKGGGHISPLGAYDKKSDSFLIMDVNSAREPWVWVDASMLIAAMKTPDTEENRGFLLIQK